MWCCSTGRPGTTSRLLAASWVALDGLQQHGVVQLGRCLVLPADLGQKALTACPACLMQCSSVPSGMMRYNLFVHQLVQQVAHGTSAGFICLMAWLTHNRRQGRAVLVPLA